MARGPAPKPAHLRQRTNRKAGATIINLGDRAPREKTPPMPNPDNRVWHPLTVRDWKNAWASPMASEWLDTDADALGRLALLWDEFYKKPNADGLKEIRLQSALFGLSPLDRSRLQWEVNRADEAEQKQTRRAEMPRRRPASGDPRRVLMMPTVKKA